MFKVNNRNTKNTRARCQICLKLTLRTLMTLISYFYCKLSSNFTHSSGISIGYFGPSTCWFSTRPFHFKKNAFKKHKAQNGKN